MSDSDGVSKSSPDKTSKVSWIQFLLGLLFFGGGLFLLSEGFGIFIIAVSGSGKCIERKVIRKIGGCDFSGNCGVEFTDYTYGKVTKPVVDQLVCTQKSWYEGEPRARRQR